VKREIPGLENLTSEKLQTLTRKSNQTLREIGAEYHCVESFVTGVKMCCVHIAPDEETVREHARRGGFPLNSIREVFSGINSTTIGE
jgi:hypothetical protein